MSRAFALPSSSRLEHDARQISAKQAEVAPGEIAIGVVVGRTSEFFDFFVYAIASVLVFPQMFFPMVDRLTGTFYALGIFSLAFVARPIGTVLFTAIDRRHGRGVKLTSALILLAGSTAAMGLLPGYAQQGAVSIGLLALCRVGQGLGLAGAWDGLASLLVLNAPRARRGWYAMMPQLGAPLGFLLAGGLFAYFASSLSAADFLDWGWRFPFFAAIAVNVVALFSRLRLVATEEYGALFERQELRPVPVRRLFKAEGRYVLIGALTPLASLALFYLVTVFPLSWITLFTREQAAGFLRIQMLAAVAGAAGIAASGLVTDRIGRRAHLVACALLIAVFGFVAPLMLSGGAWSQAAFLVLGFGLLGLSFGQAAGAVGSNFSRQYRYTGAAVASDMSWLIGAGLAPLAALALATRFGLPATGAYLIGGAACTLAALALKPRSLTET